MFFILIIDRGSFSVFNMSDKDKEISSPVQTASIRSPMAKGGESPAIGKKEATKSIKKALLTSPAEESKKKTLSKER